MPVDPPKLSFLHAKATLNQVKLEYFRRLPTEVLKSTLVPGETGSLKVRPDGTVLDGHHRLQILIERHEDVDRLPREIMEKDS